MQKKFILRALLFFSPVWIILFLYLMLDPFKVLRKYNEYFPTDTDFQITLNRGYIATELYLLNNDNYRYDSFILGNSRGYFYPAVYWGAIVGGMPFHFNANSESLFGIYNKIRFLDSYGANIKNVLIVMDREVLGRVTNRREHIFIQHPKVSMESGLSFHFTMFKAFCSKALLAYTELAITGKKRAYMGYYGIEVPEWEHDRKYNQYVLKYEKQIEEDLEGYYSKIGFYQRDTVQKISNSTIRRGQELLLKKMAKIFQKHGTSVKIIISPLYDQIRICPRDLEYLMAIFGGDNVFDFSGINELTGSKYNYYEESHYRPGVAKRVIDAVYLQ